MARNGLAYFEGYQLETWFVHSKFESYHLPAEVPSARRQGAAA
jgi:hypothetical protein